ncbi:uncharacterized protein EI90DRAFT_3015723 [Cantharellus anzutake]|uniref:uncharacterized protein n=1 Tax=Cantharellus anzutake TaxID=1750568 RepID=UPI0019048E1A|nr:uncharacterized protein EI90DRAFT_3015723 [Cantharellus anzutake]KAF8332671.1 hypothetical protein EI90DRAFT_3015723 [Cantharellus anzutake]
MDSTWTTPDSVSLCSLGAMAIMFFGDRHYLMPKYLMVYTPFGWKQTLGPCLPESWVPTAQGVGQWPALGWWLRWLRSGLGWSQLGVLGWVMEDWVAEDCAVGDSTVGPGFNQLYRARAMMRSMGRGILLSPLRKAACDSIEVMGGKFFGCARDVSGNRTRGGIDVPIMKGAVGKLSV